MGGGVSKEKIEEMKDEFLKEDTDNNGTVSLDELKKYRKKAEGDKYDEAAVEADFKKFDQNGDGHLQLDEYLESHGVSHKVAEKVHNEESIKHAMSEQILTRAEDERHIREDKLTASVTAPGLLDKKSAMVQLGSDFDNDKFEALAVDGKIKKEQLAEAKTAANATATGAEEEVEAPPASKESVIALVHASQVKAAVRVDTDYMVDGKAYNTANDKAAEDEFSALAKEADAEEKDNKGPGFVMLTTVEQADMLEGTWERIIAEPTFYINISTFEVSIIRPSSFEAEVEAKVVVDEVVLPSFHINDIEAELARIFREEQKTPLILARINDTPDTASVVEHLKGLKSTVVIDIKPLGLGYAKCGVKSEEVTAPARKELVGALKQGDMIVAFDMGDTAPNLATILKNKKHSKCIPPKIFEFGKLTTGPVARSMYTDDDREPPGETGKTVFKQNVNVVVLCSHTADDYIDSLDGKMTAKMDKFYPIDVYSRS
jgi:Ca2+-binding EF-hand superfamily protein